MASYRRAKERLFTEVLPRSREAGVEAEAVLNLDDPVGRELVGLVEERAIPVTSYGLEHAPSDVSGTIVEASLEGTTLAVETSGGESFTFEMSLLGTYNAENALAATATALSIGIDSEVVQQGLTDIDAISGRLERIGSPSTGPHVYVDYAHTPDALERVLQTLRPLTPGRLVAVFGCGGDRDRDKRPEMGRIADAVADRIWITSDNPRTEDPVAIIEDIVGGLPALDSVTSDEHRERRVEPERHRAIERAIDEAVRDDVVLIAGKGHEQYQEIDGERHDFDDAERARQALGRYAPRRDKP